MTEKIKCVRLLRRYAPRNDRFLILPLFLSLLFFSGPTFASDPLESLSNKLKTEIKTKTPPTLAVLNFLYARGRMSTGSYLVSERLVTYFVREGATVIERRMIQKMLEERKLYESGLVDPAVMQKMGGLLGVDAVVVGTLSDLSETRTDVMARVIQVNTGEILAAGSINIPRIWRDSPKIPRLAQARALVPSMDKELLLSGEGEAAEKSPSPMARARLSDLENMEKRRGGYRPAPVPFYRITFSEP